MLIAIIGESCTGKSTLADKLKGQFNATVYTGKDYLRLAKSPAEAEAVFKKLLAESVDGENVIYVISESEHLALLPENCFKILVTAPLSVIKERFAARMRGILPPPVEAMLERNHGKFDGIQCDFHYENADGYSALEDKIRSTKCK
ncbi:MAG: hypothetical protein K2N23_01815 [Clostridia bacterium]|nr:hypothetical protein [Clostridia bacterium]